MNTYKFTKVDDNHYDVVMVDTDEEYCSKIMHFDKAVAFSILSPLIDKLGDEIVVSFK